MKYLTGMGFMLLLVIFLLQDVAIQGTINPTSVITDLTPIEKDWDSYKIPLKLQEMAPGMQADVYKLLAYETKRFQVKPNFVFLDRGKRNQGLLNLLVAHMSILHLVYSKEGVIQWEGSLYFQTEHGITVYSKEGYEIDLLPNKGRYTLRFIASGDQFQVQLPTRKESVLNIEHTGSSLFAYLLLMPTSIPPD